MTKRIAPKWFRPNYTRDGVPIPSRTMPKERLSPAEARILALLLENKIDTPRTSKTMREILALHRKEYAELTSFETADCSAALTEIKENFFVTKTPPKLVRVKSTETTFTKGRARFWLTDAAKTGKLTIDSDRWVILNDAYIADDARRRKRGSHN